MIKSIKMQRYILFVFFLIFVLSFPNRVIRAEIMSITVEGEDRLSQETVLGIAGFQQGSDLSSEDINNGLKRLNDSGLFSEIGIEQKGNNLIIRIAENLYIEGVFFEGNKVLADNILNELIKSKRRQPFNSVFVKEDVKLITDLYKEKGRFNATVNPAYIVAKNNGVNLIFEIDEGALLKVDQISFIGNTIFSDDRLRAIIPSKQRSIFSFLTDSDNFSLEMQKKDELAIEKFYQKSGFVDAEVTSSTAKLSNDLSKISLTYKINEGTQYILGDVTIKSKNTDILAEDYANLISLQKGDSYNKAEILDIIKKIERVAVSKGLPFLKVEVDLDKIEGSNILDLVFNLKKGQKLYIERINIKGNNQTFDKVIRREFSIIEGDAFNPVMLKKIEEKLRATGFFEKVILKVSPGSSSEKAIISVEVIEAPTGSLNFGAGYSTDTKLTGSLSLTERNLLGKGQKLNLQLSTSRNSNSLNFSFLEPSFLNREVSAGINLSLKQTDPSESTYSSNSFSLSPSLGFIVGPDSKMNLSYKIESLEINSENSLSAVLRSDDGHFINSSISSSFVFDKRDSMIEPKNGYILRLKNTLSGIGGDVGYIKNSLRTKFHKSFLSDKLVLSAEFEGGSLRTFTGYSRITDRFKLGGRNLRGFQFGEVGPRDITGDSLGGDNYVIGRVEANFPLGLPEELRLYGGIFTEAGSLWGLKAKPEVFDSIMYSDSHLRSSVGVSLYWGTPIGPLQFNWAKPIDYIEDVDKTEKFSLNLATRF